MLALTFAVEEQQNSQQDEFTNGEQKKYFAQRMAIFDYLRLCPLFIYIDREFANGIVVSVGDGAGGYKGIRGFGLAYIVEQRRRIYALVVQVQSFLAPKIEDVFVFVENSDIFYVYTSPEWGKVFFKCRRAQAFTNTHKQT
ncbi:MAG: hypothetical protein IKJ34_02495 [Mailhella sp.]|nr:hypothetical protein [Mailhella sp.]